MNTSQSTRSTKEESFADLFAESLKAEPIAENKLVSGKVVQITKDYILIDIGYKSEGQVPVAEFTAPDGTLTVKVGDTVDVVLKTRESENGLCVLSKKDADFLKVWDDVAQACERDELVEGTVLQRVKGGLDVSIRGGVKAFLPGSQVDLRPVRNLEMFLGKTYKFKVIKFNKKRGNIVLSRRALLEKERAELKENTVGGLTEGQIVEGIVKNLTEYGAFIDLGGLDGLLHVTDMSWSRINHPSELFRVGDQIKVKVLKFDADTERVSLGIKQMAEDPWLTVPERYQPGTVVKGKVVSLKDYGAFVELEEGVEGLIHVSEMSWTRRIKHPSKMVAMGDTIEAVVLEIDTVNKRISLGMKQLEPNPYEALWQKYPVGSKVKGKVRSVTDFGLFVEIEDGIDGLVHVSDISWTQRVKHPAEQFAKNDEIEAVVLQIENDGEKPKISLGIKQLTEDPWGRIPFDYPVGKTVSVKVQKVMDFGIFVELEPGIDGLIHISEIAHDKNAFKPGQEVQAEIVSLDPVERKIGLSIQAVQRRTEVAAAQGYKPSDSGAKLGDIFSRQRTNKKRRNEENDEE